MRTRTHTIAHTSTHPRINTHILQHARARARTHTHTHNTHTHNTHTHNTHTHKHTQTHTTHTQTHTTHTQHTQHTHTISFIITSIIPSHCFLSSFLRALAERQEARDDFDSLSQEAVQETVDNIQLFVASMRQDPAELVDGSEASAVLDALHFSDTLYEKLLEKPHPQQLLIAEDGDFRCERVPDVLQDVGKGLSAI